MLSKNDTGSQETGNGCPITGGGAPEKLAATSKGKALQVALIQRISRIMTHLRLLCNEIHDLDWLGLAWSCLIGDPAVGNTVEPLNSLCHSTPSS